MLKIKQLSVVAIIVALVVVIVALLASDRLSEQVAVPPQIAADLSAVVEPSAVAEPPVGVEPSKLTGDSAPASPGMVIRPRVVESARDMMHFYPSSATLVLPELSLSEEQKIMDLISHKDAVYLTIKRDVSHTIANWKLLGTKKAADIWQLHIKSPNAVGMQVLFSQAALPTGMQIKIYSGQKEVASHIGEHLGSRSERARSFWSTHVRGDTIVIEVWVPQGSNLNPSNFPFEIKSINHYFRDSSAPSRELKHFGFAASDDSASCNVVNPPACPAEEEFPLYRAVVSFLYTQPSGRTIGCTGGFINNLRDDGELYLLTALHCISPGVPENTTKGSALSAQIRTAESRCSTSSERLVSNDIKFIAANEQADWALLWVNKNDLQRADGSSAPIALPRGIGWDSSFVPLGTRLGNLHHAQGKQQNYTEVQVDSFTHKVEPVSGLRKTYDFEGCDLALCTHYNVDYIEGEFSGGASGSLFWSDLSDSKGPYIRGVLTHAYGSACRRARVSRFRKMYEDGRVRCALRDGSAYYPSETSTCTDTVRPIYEPLLSSLSPSTGTIYPNFHSRIMHYAIVVGNHVEQITLTMQANDRSYRIIANSSLITSSVTVPLDTGSNRINVQVQTASRRMVQTYTLEVIRLSSQAVDPVGTWENTFTERYLRCSSNPYRLGDRRDFVVSEITKTSEGTLSIFNQSDQILYTQVDSQGANRATLNARYDAVVESSPTTVADTMRAVLVSDQELVGLGIARYIDPSLALLCSLSYVAKFSRVGLASLSIPGATLNPSFRSAIKNYTATVDNALSQIDVVAAVNSSAHTITINGSQNTTVPLVVGDNVIAIELTSPEGEATATYVVVLRRLSTAVLSDLVVEIGSQQKTLSPVFSTENLNYVLSLSSTANSITLKPTAEVGRTIQVRYTPRDGAATVPSGNAVVITPLSVGSNTIYIDVAHNEAMERYIIMVRSGLRVRLKVFLEGALQ